MSYRRQETAYPAAWLFDRLASHFGREQVFKDVDSIELGDDFVEVITTAVGSCEVLLALIGDRWLTITDEDGNRRLDDPGDFVRLEIEAALTRNVRVIPILIDNARMPHADELPASLAKLARRQALELSPGRFEADTRRLLRVLDRTISEAQEEARQEAVEPAAQRETGERAGIVAAPQAAAVTPTSAEAAPAANQPAGPDHPPDTALADDVSAVARAKPGAETTRLPAHRARSAARFVDAGFIILVVPLSVIAMEALIRPPTSPTWPWWVIVAASILGMAVTLGGVRQYAVPAIILLWIMAWHTAYSLSVIGTSHSLYSTAINVLSAESIVGAVVSVALCIWVVILLPKGIRNVNLFLAISVGCISVALVLAAVALHTGTTGVWTAAGVVVLAAALGIILTLVRTRRPRPARSPSIRLPPACRLAGKFRSGHPGCVATGEHLRGRSGMKSGRRDPRPAGR